MMNRCGIQGWPLLLNIVDNKQTAAIINKVLKLKLIEHSKYIYKNLGTKTVWSFTPPPNLKRKPEKINLPSQIRSFQNKAHHRIRVQWLRRYRSGTVPTCPCTRGGRSPRGGWGGRRGTPTPPGPTQRTGPAETRRPSLYRIKQLSYRAQGYICKSVHVNPRTTLPYMSIKNTVT